MTLEEIDIDFSLFDGENSWDISTPLEVEEYALAWKGFLLDDMFLVKRKLFSLTSDSLEKSLLRKEEGLISNYLGYINKVCGVINEVNYKEGYKLLAFTIGHYSNKDSYREEIGSQEFRMSEANFRTFFQRELEAVSKHKPVEKKKTC